MSAAMDNVAEPESKDLERLCEIEATVATGLEEIAKDEADEKLGVDSRISRGRILLQIPIKNVSKALELGCIDNLFILMTERSNFPFVDDEGKHNSHQDIIKRLIQKDPRKRRRIRRVSDKENGVNPEKNEREEAQNENKEEQGDKDVDSKQEHQKDEEEDALRDQKNDKEDKSNVTDLSEDVEDKNEESKTELDEDPALKKPRTKITTHNPLLPSFRVTCNRNGKNHRFDSMGAASNFGGAVNEYFGWNVSMKNFDIEVVLNIEETDLRVCLALTKESMHKRNIISFGPTTLRPTIAFCLLRLCKIKEGDVVCDPMCGTGSIPIQASLGWPGSYHLCGEINNKSLSRTSENIQHVNDLRKEADKKQIQLDPLKWNAHYLPLRTDSVDVFVTDLVCSVYSFLMGSKQDNWKLYPGAMMDMARTCKVGSGRATILTQDKKCFNKALAITAKYWKCWRMTGFNMGGLAGCIYSLYRTKEVFDDKDSSSWMAEVDATARKKDN
ncbi:hypothetical protein FSP39_009469 [Pinctada imbricata]|uniref:THUMP domain-containing protein n=1 Tax=Pinctada imbricata TaxID=66713 RepID=A0AA88YNB4_PINIB|nr:hypothetical protein FSP39_009469 [Pinctada imbricata]